MAIFEPQRWVNDLEKCQYFDFLNFLFLQARKAFFFALEYRKRGFRGLCCLNKKVGKMGIFGPKPWFNPIGKMSIFRLFELLVFIAQKGVFFCSRISQKTFSWRILPKKKNLEKWPFLDRNHGFGKISIFRLFEVLVFIAQKGAFFLLENMVKDIFLAYIA